MDSLGADLSTAERRGYRRGTVYQKIGEGEIWHGQRKFRRSVTISLDEHYIAKLDAWAMREGLGRSDSVAKLLELLED